MSAVNNIRLYLSRLSALFHRCGHSRSRNRIVVVGIGGCGCNMVSYAKAHSCTDFVGLVCDTDIQTMDYHDDVIRIALDHNVNEDSNVKRVMRKVIEHKPEIVILATGTVGKTGSVYAPLITKKLMDSGIITLVAATTSMLAEGPAIGSVSSACLSELKELADGVLTIDSDRLAEYYSNAPLARCFDGSIEIFSDMVKCLSVTYDAGMDNVTDILRKSGSLSVGSAYAHFDLKEAISRTISYARRYGGTLDNAENLLFRIESGDLLSFTEKDAIEIINEQVHGLRKMKLSWIKKDKVGVWVVMLGTRKN